MFVVLLSTMDGKDADIGSCSCAVLLQLLKTSVNRTSKDTALDRSV